VCILFVLGLVWLWRRTKDEDDCEILRFEIYTVQYPVLLVQYEDNEDGVYILVAENGDRKVRKQNEKKKILFFSGRIEKIVKQISRETRHVVE
jgi:hypothetical protein